MITKRKLEKFCQNVFIYFFLLGLVRKIWDVPVLDIIILILCIFFVFMMFLMIYLSWRETHSFLEVFKQNWINIVTFIIPVTVLLLYVLYDA